MAVRIIRENNRSAGMPVVSGQTIIAGQPLLLAANGETRAYNDGTGAAAVYGIAADRTTKPPMSPVSGDPAGSGYDYTNFNRGGLVSAFVNGSELELFAEDDGKPFSDAVTYALNEKVYPTAAGLISNVALGDAIGSVVSFDVATGTTRLRVKFTV